MILQYRNINKKYKLQYNDSVSCVIKVKKINGQQTNKKSVDHFYLP